MAAYRESNGWKQTKLVRYIKYNIVQLKAWWVVNNVASGGINMKSASAALIMHHAAYSKTKIKSREVTIIC